MNEGFTWRHHLLFATVAGLLAGGWAPAATPFAAVAAAMAGLPRRGLAVAAGTVVLAGAAVAHERREAIDHGRTPARAGTVVEGEVVLLERFRTRASGERVAPARWRGGWADGERLLLRRRGAPEPAAPRAEHGASAAPGAAVEGAERGVSAAPGAVLAVRGTIGPLRPFEVLQRRRGAVAALDLVDVRATERRRGGPAGALDRARARGEAGLSRGLPAREAALLRGMVLGQDDAIAPDVVEDFQVSGLAHLLAVSGTNVILLSTLVLAVGAALMVPLRWRLAAALLLVALYVPLAGGSASIQRAGVMGAAGLVAALAGRPAQRWYALGLAAAVTLAMNPYAAGEPGWQLSFAAVGGLLSLAPALRDRMRRRRVPLPVAEAAAMTIAATIATAPLLAVHFDRVSLVSLPANLVAAPAVAPIMWLGMLSAAVAQADAVLAVPFNLLNAGLVSFLAWLAHVSARMPLAAAEVGVAPVAGIYALGAAGWWWRVPLRRRLRRVRRAPALTAAAATAAVVLLVTARGGAAPLEPGETRVSFLDVGQGDATLVQRDGAALLVDTGPPGGPVVERLRDAGVRRLDALLITHAQADHEGAAPEVIARFRPRLVINGGAGWPTAVQRGLGRAVIPAAGQSLRLGRLRLDVLWPPRELIESPPEGDANDRAVVTHLRSDGFDLLLPADAESTVTAGLDLPRVEALKVAHHGSDDEGLPALLERVRPQVAAIEVGRHNTYGHPTPATLAALRVVPRVFRTDRDGTVRLRVRNGRMTVESDH